MLRELAPARCPRMAASAAEIERLAVAACELQPRDARDFLATYGFMRVRRVVRGRNVWLYKRRFCEDEEPSFVGLQSAGEYNHLASEQNRATPNGMEQHGQRRVHKHERGE